ncbi:LOG family protein [Candidatus Woesearchaeota archaeon]|nr:LOG family protein [Candidatus Woesearchaeota archaeon]
MGIMEATAKGAKSANGKTIGITTDDLDYVEPNPFLDEEIRTKNISERIRKNIELGDVFIILKGSTGTMQELMEVWNLMKLKLIPRKPIICYGSHYKDIIAKIGGVGKHKSVKVEGNLVSFAENMDALKEILKPARQP